MSGSVTSYTQKVADVICARIAEGEPLRAICRCEGMPKWRTVYDWLGKNEQFKAAFELARVVGFHAIAEEALEIANTPMVGERVEIGDDGKQKIVREDMLGHRKLQIETRLKLLAKWSPTLYGDRITTEHTGDLIVKINKLSDAGRTAG